MDGDEADEEADVKGAPGLTGEVVVREEGVAVLLSRGTGYSGLSGGYGLLFWRNEVRAECAVGFADGAVFFPVGEGDGGGLEPSAEVLEIPGVFEDLWPGPAATSFDEGVLVENMRHVHDARPV